MEIRNVKHLIAALSFTALTAYPAAVAHADDTAEEIRLLRAQLKKLEEKVNAQDRERKAAEAQIRKAAAQQTGAPANSPPIMISRAELWDTENTWCSRPEGSGVPLRWHRRSAGASE